MDNNEGKEEDGLEDFEEMAAWEAKRDTFFKRKFTEKNIKAKSNEMVKFMFLIVFYKILQKKLIFLCAFYTP